MASDLSQFKQTYITECVELLGDMEERLLSLEEGETDKETLNAIFRCAHSIKGGGGAFGFTRLVEFTHILEYLLDALRESKIDVTQDIVDSLLQSVDVVSQLVKAAQTDTELPAGFEDELKAKLEALSNGGSAPAAKSPKPAKTEVKPAQAEELVFYGITFRPTPNLFLTGNEPLLILSELNRLGELKVECDISNLNSVESLDSEKCYFTWNIELTSSKGIAAVKEAFEFVQDDSLVEIQELGAISIGNNVQQNTTEVNNNNTIIAPASASAPAENVAKPQQSPAGATPPAAATAATSIRVDTDKIDVLVNLVGELVITQAMIGEQIKGLPTDKFQGLLQGVEELTRHTRDLQESVMAVRMQPVKTIFSRMPRIVRDLSKQLGKDIRLDVHGENTEIDKTVIEQLSDPLTHMIRNSIDHGVEMPDDRIAKGKPAQGRILLSADSSGGRIILEISDDGNGINRDRVLKKAQEKGLVAPDANISNEEIDNLIFHAGFSTAETVTNVSGRGVGMDVVKRNIADLGGTIELFNQPGYGSKFVVSLPLTLAILDGMIVGVGQEQYIIPINNIIESMRVDNSDLKNVAEGNDVINVRGEFIPIIYMGQIFNIPDFCVKNDKYLVVLVESGRHRIGIVVDEIIGQQQVVIKNLEDNADRVVGVSGATILGDGNVSLILDIAQLIKISLSDRVNVRQAA
jgi:two-component system, chemotaxis family, sensor kinase CheA